MEWEEIVSYTVTTIEQNTVHACVEKWLTLPPFLDVNDDVKKRKQEECKAGCDHDEGDGPKVLVDRNPSIILSSETQYGCQNSCQQ